MEVDGSEYFTSYENLEIHELMLTDEARNEAYRTAILSNKASFQVSELNTLLRIAEMNQNFLSGQGCAGRWLWNWNTFCKEFTEKL